MRSLSSFSYKRLFVYLTVMAGVLSSAKMSDGYALAVVIPIAFAWGLSRPDRLFYAYVLSMSMVLCNDFFVPKVVAVVVVYRLMIMSVGLLGLLYIIQGRYNRVLNPLLLISPYIGFMFISSLVGWNALVSILKLTLFCGTYLFLFAISSRLLRGGDAEISSARCAVLAMAVFFVIGSVCLIPFPAISLLNKYDLSVDELLATGLTLFKGMALHSQSLGPMLAVLATFLFADLLFCVVRMDLLYLVLLTFCPILVYKTGSRTAMGTLLAGGLFVFWCLIRERSLPKAWRGRMLRLIVVGSVLLIVLGMCLPSVREKAAQFILKFDKTVTSTSEITLSEVMVTRQGRFDYCLYNFRKSPLIGNGFQVSEEYNNLNVPITKLMSAPVEKGFLVGALLEEGGVIGIGLFVAFVILMCWMLLRLKCYVAFCTFCAMLVSNCGEFTIFSMTVAGGFHWTLVFCAVVFDVDRNRKMGMSQAYGCGYNRV